MSPISFLEWPAYYNTIITTKFQCCLYPYGGGGGAGDGGLRFFESPTKWKISPSCVAVEENVLAVGN
jgi:hypothetical protein